MAKRAVHDVLSTLGTRVRRLREQKDLTQRELAEKADVSTKRLGELERGVPNAGIITLVRVAQALAVPPYALLAPENLIPPSADPTLARHFELAREAFAVLGGSMGFTPPAVRERSSPPDGDYDPGTRRRSRKKK